MLGNSLSLNVLYTQNISYQSKFHENLIGRVIKKCSVSLNNEHGVYLIVNISKLSCICFLVGIAQGQLVKMRPENVFGVSKRCMIITCWSNTFYKVINDKNNWMLQSNKCYKIINVTK